MATQDLEQMQAEQTADIAAAWEEGRMLRKELEEGKLRVVILVKGKVVDDYYSLFDDNGESTQPLPAAHSLVGERVSEKSLRESGYRKGKNVIFNTITREIEVR